MLKRFSGWAHTAEKLRKTSVFLGLVVPLLFLLVFRPTGLPRWLVLAVPVLVIFRPGSRLYSKTFDSTNLMQKIVTALTAAVTIGVCVLPMNQLPLWNGEIPDHRNQYELMAEALLDGHLYLDYEDDALSQLHNPYDPDERYESGAAYHWDHAYYNGHYYMYFGIVPVLVLFLPYRVLTGMPLTTYHATQVFVAAIIIGFFALFHMLVRRFFKKLPFVVYLALSAAFSIMSVWYSVAEPALYCTAITAGIAFEVWSLYFFIKAVWDEKRENRQIRYAFTGSLLGALVFGCRPPIALANVLVIPMLIVFIKQRPFTLSVLRKLILAALPYLIVGAALMLYNHARFDDPFEFGQRYQLTVADQTNFGLDLSKALIVRVINDTINHLFYFSDMIVDFPFLTYSGLFFNFPILLLSAGVFKTSVRQSLRRENLTLLICGLALTILLISVVDILWSPYLLERYQLDIYFIAAILCFAAIGFWHEAFSSKYSPWFCSIVVLLALWTIAASFLGCMRTINVYYPETVVEIGRLLLE